MFLRSTVQLCDPVDLIADLPINIKGRYEDGEARFEQSVPSLLESDVARIYAQKRLQAVALDLVVRKDRTQVQPNTACLERREDRTPEGR